MKLSAEVQMYAIALVIITFLSIILAVVAFREIPQENVEKEGNTDVSDDVALIANVEKSPDTISEAE